MFLHHFKKKENNLKKHTDNMYLSIIKFIDSLYLNQDYKLKKEFNTSFEITTILIFTIFFAYKQKKNAELNQMLLNTYIEDMDHSLRNLGISDMKIGKYVKAYVKKIYYRFDLLDSIFSSEDFGKFSEYILKLKICNDSIKSPLFSIFLYNYINNSLNMMKIKTFSKYKFK